MKIKIARILDNWLPAVLWAYMIFHFSSGSVPVTSAVYWQDFAFKKAGHFIFFGILAVLVYRGLLGEGVDRTKAFFLAVIITAIYGATDEFHQTFTQGREARIRDVLIDTMGALSFSGITYYFLPQLPKKIKILGERLGFL